MRRLTLAGKKSPVVRQQAVALTQGLRQKDFYAEIKALFRFVRDRIRYVRDVRNVETLHIPEMVLSNQQGDCDDKSILLASLLESLGFRTRFLAVGFRPNEYRHVYVEVFYNGQWLPLETTESVDIGWRPKNVVSQLIVVNDDGLGGLGTLGGKRVKKVLAQVAATAAAAAAAAAARPNDAAAQQYAADWAARNAGEQASFAAKEATKKKGFAKIVQKVKAVRARIDPVAKTQAAVALARKVGIRGAIKQETTNLKNEHLKATKLMAATGSPSFKKHARYEENKYKRTELKGQLVQIQSQLEQRPGNQYLLEQQSSVVEQLNVIAQQDKKYLKEGKIAATIASIIIGIFTLGGGSVAVQGAFQALKEGAVEIAKKILMGAIAAAVAKGGSKSDAAKAKAAVDALSKYPPDPNSPTLDAMIQDSQAQQQAAQSKTLAWLIPAGLFLLSSIT